MVEALAEMEGWPDNPPEARRQRLWGLLGRMQAEQNEHRSIPFGAVREIHDWELLVAENAVSCMLNPREAGQWAYQIARDYTERYDPDHGTGLIPESAPLVQEVVDFWAQEFGLDAEALTAPTSASKAPAPTTSKTGPGKGSSSKRKSQPQFTPRQGQFLAFVHLYRKLHRRGPAELDLVKFFRVTPPAVHLMLVKLEELGLITREPGVARSARLTVPVEELPPLEDVEGPPW
jgi:hypothetical protein